jgi:hypothetical protein
MSKTESYRRVAREDLVAHGEGVIQKLLSQEGYAEVAEQAEALGVSISVYMQDTFTDEMRNFFELAEDEEDIPYGYQANLRIDIVRDGRILFVCDEAGAYDQLSVSFPIIVTPETFLGRKLKFIDFEEIDGCESIIDYIADFLDAVNDGKGGVTSVLFSNNVEVDLPENVDMITSLSDLPQGDVVELLPGDFEGVYLGEKSAFFAGEAFAPFCLLLEAREFGFYISHGVSVLDAEKWKVFSDDIKQFCQLLRRSDRGFTDILSQMQLYSLEPCHTHEKHLNRLTALRKEEFIQTCQALLDWGNALMEEGKEQKISILWI